MEKQKSKLYLSLPRRTFKHLLISFRVKALSTIHFFVYLFLFLLVLRVLAYGSCWTIWSFLSPHKVLYMFFFTIWIKRSSALFELSFLLWVSFFMRINDSFETIYFGLKVVFPLISVHMVFYILVHFEFGLSLLLLSLVLIATILRLVEQLAFLLVT